MRVHHHMMDAVSRLLMESFKGRCGVDETPDFSLIMSIMETKNVEEVLRNTELKFFMASLETFINGVRDNNMFGKTAQFWVEYVDCVWTLLRFQKAIKENNFQHYVTSLRQMCPLLFAADRLNYARYLPIYCTQLMNLHESHPRSEILLEKSGLTASQSYVSGCRNALDLTIEQTINRSAKTVGGVIGFTLNKNAYHRWCLTRHERGTFLEVTRELLDMSHDPCDAHKSTRPSEMKRSDSDVKRIVAAFNNFIDPFSVTLDKNHLHCISSGQQASDAVTDDLLRFVQKGERAFEDFVASRLVKRDIPFHDTLRKLNLKTFASMALKKTLTTSQKKTVQVTAERNFLGQLLILSTSNDINFDKLLDYQLSPIPWSLATADGCFVKTDKSQLMHLLEDKTSSGVSQLDCLPDDVVIDGNALLQSVVKLPETFGQLAMTIFKLLPKARVAFSDRLLS